MYGKRRWTVLTTATTTTITQVLDGSTGRDAIAFDAAVIGNAILEEERVYEVEKEQEYGDADASMKYHVNELVQNKEDENVILQSLSVPRKKPRNLPSNPTPTSTSTLSPSLSAFDALMRNARSLPKSSNGYSAFTISSLSTTSTSIITPTSPISTRKKHKSINSKPRGARKISTSQKFESENNEPNTTTKPSNPDLPDDLNEKQVYLDLGQQNTHAVCKVCSMIYQPGVEVDEVLHQSVHKKYLYGMKFTEWKNELEFCVQMSPPMTTHVNFKSLPSDDRILCFRSMHLHSSPSSKTTLRPSQREKVIDVLAELHRTLGAAEKNSLDAEEALYIYLRNIGRSRHVAGMCKVRSLTEAFEVVPISGSDTEPSTSSQSSSSCVRLSSILHPCSLGIEHIHVFQAYRKSGIATALVNAARVSFNYANIIECPHEVAFSQPTRDGRIFAQRYTLRDNFLAYS